MTRVVIHHRAAKYLQKLPRPKRDALKEVLSRLQENPLEHPHIRHMVGDWAGYHRIRVGDIRIIFWFEEDEDTIYVDYIGPRGDVYKSGD